MQRTAASPPQQPDCRVACMFLHHTSELLFDIAVVIFHTVKEEALFWPQNIPLKKTFIHIQHSLTLEGIRSLNLGLWSRTGRTEVKGKLVFECESHSYVKAKVMSLIALLWNEVQKHGCQLSSPSGPSKPRGRTHVPFHACYPLCIIGKHNKTPLQYGSPADKQLCSHLLASGNSSLI